MFIGISPLLIKLFLFVGPFLELRFIGNSCLSNFQIFLKVVIVCYIRKVEFNHAKDKFLQSWGTLGSNWGINKTMAQIHALLLISPHALSTEEIMSELSISRGNANMNIRALIDWGLVQKEYKSGERKEFFSSEKDIWQVALKVMRERRKRELEPVVHLLEDLKTVEGQSDEVEEFKKVISDLGEFTGKVDHMLEKLSKSDQHFFLNLLLKAV